MCIICAQVKATLSIPCLQFTVSTAVCGNWNVLTVVTLTAARLLCPDSDTLPCGHGSGGASRGAGAACARAVRRERGTKNTQTVLYPSGTSTCAKNPAQPHSLPAAARLCRQRAPAPQIMMRWALRGSPISSQSCTSTGAVRGEICGALVCCVIWRAALGAAQQGEARGGSAHCAAPQHTPCWNCC